MVTYLAAILMTKIGVVFQEHQIGALSEEKDKTENMMHEVLSVAERICGEATDAIDVVTKLNDSTGVVTDAMKEITAGTQDTAENIQNQTIMTQSIQESIENTLKCSEKMVGSARTAAETNENSIEIMEKLKTRAESISETNAIVAETMQFLKTKAESVRGVADTIFEISSQTNLLALNASIESARTGRRFKH